ncbi:MAG: hypothetical protein K1X67_24095 [Fimbriimonadaceae bacterium]|nr:hypothetical protein [Fimbriimonadaceae bacterium]
MEKIPVGVAAEVERLIPDVIEEVQSRTNKPVVIHFHAFAGNPELFYNCVWYITSYGKRVIIDFPVEDHS